MAFTNFKGIRRRTVFNVVSKDITGLSQSLLNKRYVHALPTQLLIQAHNKIELQHFENPKNKRLQKVHTHLFLEMQVRDLDHFDSADFFTPSPLNWPYDESLNDNEIDQIFSKFTRFNNKLKGRYSRRLR